MNAKETLELISKQWCTLEDLMRLTGIGRNAALKIRNDLKNNLIKEGYTLPGNLLPMVEVVKYLKIDINYLIKVLNLSK